MNHNYDQREGLSALNMRPLYGMKIYCPAGFIRLRLAISAGAGSALNPIRPFSRARRFTSATIGRGLQKIFLKITPALKLNCVRI